MLRPGLRERGSAIGGGHHLKSFVRQRAPQHIRQFLIVIHD
jgi:hypothetical protein